MEQTLKHEIDRKKAAQMNRRTVMQNKEKKKERETAAHFNSRQPISSTSSSVMAPDSSGEVWMYGLSNWLDWFLENLLKKNLPLLLWHPKHIPHLHPAESRAGSAEMKLILEEAHAACSNGCFMPHFHWFPKGEDELKDNAGLFLTPCSGAANANDKAGTFGWSAVQKKPTRSCYIRSAQKHTLVSIWLLESDHGGVNLPRRILASSTSKSPSPSVS